jgi:hypothetical protein
VPIQSTTDISDERRLLTLASGEVVEIRFEDDSVAVYAGGEEVGRLSFRQIEEPEDTYYHMTHAFIEGGGGAYKRQGIGTEAIRLFLECTGGPITFSDDDGIQRDDGSHLTGDAPGFVASIKAKLARGEL